MDGTRTLIERCCSTRISLPNKPRISGTPPKEICRKWGFYLLKIVRLNPQCNDLPNGYLPLAEKNKLMKAQCYALSCWASNLRTTSAERCLNSCL
jgi:hypothetical protein